MTRPRPINVRKPTSPPIAKVIAASWNAGIFPVATVSTASSDHIRIAVSPISVAVRDVISSSLRAKRSNPSILHSDNWIASSQMLLANDENKQSHHILSAVDRERRAGDGAGFVGGEEHHGAGDFFGLAEAIARDQRQDGLRQPF